MEAMELPRMGPREIVYQNSYQQISRLTADFGGYRKEFWVTDYGQRVGIVVVHHEALLLVRQYRLLLHRLSWEIPGGGVDDGETPETAAVRECLEETGVRCQYVQPLLSFHPGLDTLHNPTHVFYTDKLVATSSDIPHMHEVEQHEWVALTRCIDMIFTRQIVDSLSIVALLSYQTLRERWG